MPIYAYRCAECGHAQDVLRKLSDPPLTVCPACGASAFEKQVTAAGFQLKGSGWYVTDFRNRAAQPDARGKPDDAAPAAEAAGGEAKPAGGEAAPAAGAGEKAGAKAADKAADKAGAKPAGGAGGSASSKGGSPDGPGAKAPAAAPAGASKPPAAGTGP